MGGDARGRVATALAYSTESGAGGDSTYSALWFACLAQRITGSGASLWAIFDDGAIP